MLVKHIRLIRHIRHIRYIRDALETSAEIFGRNTGREQQFARRNLLLVTGYRIV